MIGNSALTQASSRPHPATSPAVPSWSLKGGFGRIIARLIGRVTASKDHVLRCGAAVMLLLVVMLPEVARAQNSQISEFTTYYRYNGKGQVIGTITPDPDGPSGPLGLPAQRTSYDPVGLPVKTETGYLAAWQPTSVLPQDWPGFTVVSSENYAYDTMNRRVKTWVVDKTGATVSVTQSNTDREGRTACTAIRMNAGAFGATPANACELGQAGSDGADRITRNYYDAAGQLIQIHKAVGTPLEQAYSTYTYTVNGKQQIVIDANGNQARFDYDGFDRQIKWTFPSTAKPAAFDFSNQASAVASAGALNTADTEQYNYDDSGNRVWLKKRDNSTFTFEFDKLNRMTKKVVPERSGLDGTHTRDVYYGYDLRGLTSSVRFDSDSGPGIATEYDGFGRIRSSTIALDGPGRKLSYEYDEDGNRTRVEHPDATWFKYEFDRLDRPTAIYENGTTLLRGYGYNQRGLLKSQASAGGSGGTTGYAYDNAGRLNSLTRDVAGSAEDSTTTFGYNAALQLTSENRTNPLYSFGSRFNVSRDYHPNGLNQYESATGANFCYDPNGNLTADGEFVYLYDAENRLVEKREQTTATCSSLSYTGTLKASLRYDPMGRLYETVGPTTNTTRFLIDGDAMVGENDAFGGLLRRYVHGADGKADDPIVWYEVGTGVRHFLNADRQGSIVLTSDTAGDAERIFRFDEYGIPDVVDGGSLTPATGARFLFTGQALLPEAGLYYYKARMYSPTLGRFMQTDPIGYSDQMDLYSYVGNDPVNRVDPTGQNAVATAARVGAKVGCAATAEVGCVEGAVIGAAVGAGAVTCAGISACRQSAIRTAVDLCTSSITCAAAVVMQSTIGRIFGDSDAKRKTAVATDGQSGQRPVYHRLESPTQTPADALRQQQTGLIGGYAARGSSLLSVKAYSGPLPPGERGIEFTTSVLPGNGSVPGQPKWYAGQPGVSVINGDKGEMAVIPAIILRNTQH